MVIILIGEYMNRYIGLLICFLVSLCIIEYDKNDYYINNRISNDSILVFNEIVEEEEIVNPDTSDIDILVISIICVYSFIFVYMLFRDIKKIRRYCDVVIN